MTALEDFSTLPGNRWTPVEDAIVKLALPLPDIADRLHKAGYLRSLDAVAHRRRRNGLRNRSAIHWTAAEDGVVVLPIPLEDIAARLHRSVNAVAGRRARLRSCGVSIPDRRGSNLRGSSPTAAWLAAGAECRKANNAARAKAAGPRQAEAAAAVLRDRPPTDPTARRVLELRVEYPEAALADLGAMMGFTKDAYNGRLQRQLKPPSPPQLQYRNETIIDAACSGSTVAQIAVAEGLTERRVYQLLAEARRDD